MCVLAGGDECGGCGVSFHFTLFIATADSSYIVAGDPLSLSSSTHAHTHTERERERERERDGGRERQNDRDAESKYGAYKRCSEKWEGITVFRCAL